MKVLKTAFPASGICTKWRAPTLSGTKIAYTTSILSIAIATNLGGGVRVMAPAAA
jgi:hypothetical protein